MSRVNPLPFACACCSVINVVRGLLQTKTIETVKCPAIISLCVYKRVCVCRRGGCLHVPLVSHQTGVTLPKNCLRLSSTTMYPSGLFWFYLSQPISRQSIQVRCFYHLIYAGCYWSVTADTEINTHLLVLFMSDLAENITMMCVFPPLSDQLFHVLAMHMRLYSIDSAYNPWTKLTQVTQSREAE